MPWRFAIIMSKVVFFTFREDDWSFNECSPFLNLNKVKSPFYIRNGGSFVKDLFFVNKQRMGQCNLGHMEWECHKRGIRIEVFITEWLISHDYPMIISTWIYWNVAYLNRIGWLSVKVFSFSDQIMSICYYCSLSDWAMPYERRQMRKLTIVTSDTW